MFTSRLIFQLPSRAIRFLSPLEGWCRRSTQLTEVFELLYSKYSDYLKYSDYSKYSNYSKHSKNSNYSKYSNSWIENPDSAVLVYGNQSGIIKKNILLDYVVHILTSILMYNVLTNKIVLFIPTHF